MEDLPLPLRHAMEAGECVLFIGSGIGHYYKNGDGDALPDGEGLAKNIANHFSIDVTGDYELSKIAKIVEIRKKGRQELVAHLKSLMIPTVPDENVQWLTKIKWKAIFTTNYDRGIETAYDKTATSKQNPIVISTTSDLEQFDPRFDIPIYHLHGLLFDKDPNIIITDDDYSKFSDKRKMLFELLKKEFITSTIIYIGYSNRDPNWKLLIHEIETEFYPKELPQSFRISPNPDPLDTEILSEKNITNIDLKFHEFVAIASANIEEIEDDDGITKKYPNVPLDLRPSLERNPAPTVRLLSSWEYVNQADFSIAPNTKRFLDGDTANWALIGNGIYFERDLEEDLYDDLLDHVTSTKRRTKTNILLAPAGYGTTTLLMTMAVKLVKDRACNVFRLKPGRKVIEGDVLFAESIFGEKTCFIIDHAADHKSSLSLVLQRFREDKKHSLILLGERLNEWRQTIDVIHGKEYLIDALSDPEINRLLDFLGSQGALNKLEPLDRELQFNSIKKNYEKELLVAMREATEGLEFDAILENEFRGIDGDLPKQAYLTVCCFSLNGIFVRDSLLAELLNLDVIDLYDKTSKQTEGIIIYEEVDESRGEFGARTRHRSIAEVVWERCGIQYNKGEILKNIIDRLNLNYYLDVRAFDLLYQSDKLVDSINSLDEKIRFFEKACKKDPDSPYVRQHFARMLIREKSYELALSQIENAISIDKGSRILYHTKGLILARMAFERDSDSVALKRLHQSENSYRKALNMNTRDPYCYQGLAKLYLQWAERTTDNSESLDYLSKAEDIIGEGLRNCRNRDKLWIESAKVQEFIGNHPGYIMNLERAVSEFPDSIVPRYILGRTYRREKKYKEAIDTLKPVIKNHPNEFRSFVEYALAKYYDGAPYDECISVLRLSTLYGYSDPRFISVLGGLLFINKEYSDADRVFSESTNRRFTITESTRIEFRPFKSIEGEPYKISGKVVNVKPGYARIESNGLPAPIHCPGSKYRGLTMKKGLIVSFHLCFNARGPVSEDIAI